MAFAWGPIASKTEINDMPLALTNAPVSHAALPVELAEPFRGPARIPKARPRNAQAISRRPGREQGLALEQLGHAVEYLIDSRMFLTGIAYTRAEEQALQILMAASREVFEGCPAIVPWRKALGGWFGRSWRGMMGRQAVRRVSE